MISPLPFDSALFGYPVGKVTINENWDEQAFLEKAKDFKLVYLVSNKQISYTDTSIKLVDIKVTYSKPIVHSAEMPLGIRQYKGEFDDKLLQLAFESGVFSRFNLDPRMTQNEFKKLYTIWIKKAWDSNTILEVPDLKGMVSYSTAGESASIGLIAVDKNNQGNGWGKKLMKAAESQAFSLGAKTLEVSTQELNSPASRLYESLGYELVEKTFVHHYCA